MTVFSTNSTVFIGSSMEGLRLAEAIQLDLARESTPKLWTSIFGNRPFASNLDQLRECTNVDFAVLVLTPDDSRLSREVETRVPRDNLILELGLFLGALGPDRVVFVVPGREPPTLPTDILGLAGFEYWCEHAELPNLSLDAALAAVGPAVTRIKDHIRRVGARAAGPTITGYGPTSRIEFNRNVALNDTELSFLVGYSGDGLLNEVSFYLYYISIELGSDGNRYRNWTLLTLAKPSIPEVRYTWCMSHDLGSGQLPGSPTSLEDLQALPGIFHVTVRGTDDAGRRRRNRMVFEPSAIRRGRFPPVDHPEIEPKVFDGGRPIDWSEFYNFQELDVVKSDAS